MLLQALGLGVLMQEKQKCHRYKTGAAITLIGFVVLKHLNC